MRMEHKGPSDLNHRRDRYASESGLDDDQQSALLNEYYATLTAQQQKLLQEKTPIFANPKTSSPRSTDMAEYDNRYSRKNRFADETSTGNMQRSGRDRDRSNSIYSNNGGQPLATEDIRQQIQDRQYELIEQIREQVQNIE